MQKFIKFIALFSLFACCIAKELEIFKHLYQFSTFNYKGILEINNGTHLLNYDNESQNSLEIFYKEKHFDFELFYNDQIQNQRISGSIDCIILDNMQQEMGGYYDINFQQSKNNGISENYKRLLYYKFKFNETKIFQNGESFEQKIFFISPVEHDFYMNLTIQFENSYRHQIFDSLTIFLIYITLQALQFQCLFIFFKQIHQNKIWELKKVFIYPYYFLVVFNIVFLLEIIIQLGNINNKYEWFYILPISLSFFATLFMQMVTSVQLTVKVYQSFLQRHPNCFNFSITLLISIYENIQDLLIYASLCLIFFNLDTSPYYLIFISTLFIPQIIYNFKFRIIELNGIYYLKLMAVNIFQIVNMQSMLKLYTRGCPKYNRNNLSNTEKIVSCSITSVLFCLQILIIHFQYQHGPRNSFSAGFRTKSEQSLFNKLADDDICPICLSELKDENIFNKRNGLHNKIFIKTSCHHIFHQKCLELWYKKKQSCPYCNAQIQLLEEIGQV